MSETAEYSAVELTRDGRRVEIRALRPEHRAELLAAIGRTSTQSLFRRFFAAKRGFTNQEIEFFLHVDFINHVALVAVIPRSSAADVTSSCNPGRRRWLSR